MKYSYEEKAEALKKDLVRKARIYNKFIQEVHINSGKYLPEVQKQLIQKFETKSGASWKMLMSISRSRYARAQRIKSRIQNYIQQGNGVFYTLTFRDEVLATTSEDTRRQYVRRWLSKNFIMYVANIDYGENTEREHYHAVVSPIDGLIPEDWPHGFQKLDWIRIDGPSDIRLSKYMSKLTNHALKNSGAMKRVIFSKKIPL